MARISLDALTKRVTTYFRRRADQYGLQASTLEARYIFNWGGFVNASFNITDGQVSYHLKLADDEEVQDQLALWLDLNDLLAENYHAPRILAPVEIPGSGFAGLLFPHFPGRPADLAHQPQVLRGVLDLLARLHADKTLAAQLAGDDPEPLTCAGYFLDTYIDRFDGDLLVIAPSLPPFVPLPLLDWMMGETRELEGLARDDPAFQRPADAPTHGDLWASNILVGEDGGWRIIDWDDLALGDPAVEYSLLLGRLWMDGHISRTALDDLLPADPDLHRRFDLCLRSFVLDQIIDSLADWVEADFAPEHQARVQAAKQQTHQQALAFYRQTYGGS